MRSLCVFCLCVGALCVCSLGMCIGMKPREWILLRSQRNYLTSSGRTVCHDGVSTNPVNVKKKNSLVPSRNHPPRFFVVVNFIFIFWLVRLYAVWLRFVATLEPQHYHFASFLLSKHTRTYITKGVLLFFSGWQVSTHTTKIKYTFATELLNHIQKEREKK